MKMNKTILATVLALSTAVAVAQTDTPKQGGFQAPNQPAAMQKNDLRQERRDIRRENRQAQCPQMGQYSQMGRYPQMGQYHPQMRQYAPHHSGFIQSNAPSKVADAANWQDDQIVLLEGKIIKQVGKKDYVFKDASGELEIEIAPRAWMGMVTAEDEVKIIADVEKSWGKTEVTAHHVIKAKAGNAAPTKPAEAPQQ